MKKLLCAIAVAAVSAAGIFAADFGAFPTGTWQDSKWNANWEFGVGSLKLKDANTNEVLFDFDGKMEDFKVEPSISGLSVSFKCEETHREYKFTKPTSMETSIDMEIHPDWTSDAYKVTMPFQK